MVPYSFCSYIGTDKDYYLLSKTCLKLHFVFQFARKKKLGLQIKGPYGVQSLLSISRF